MSETQTNTTDDTNDRPEPKPCRRLFAIRETKNGTEMWTCTGCRRSLSSKEKFRELEVCQR